MLSEQANRDVEIAIKAAIARRLLVITIIQASNGEELCPIRVDRRPPAYRGGWT